MNLMNHFMLFHNLTISRVLHQGRTAQAKADLELQHVIEGLDWASNLETLLHVRTNTYVVPE